MPFATCKSCGRLFHTFDPITPEPAGGYLPNLGLGDVIHELCPECLKMTRDHQHNPDPNVNAARIVAESTSAAGGTIADLEAAWAEWSSHLQKVDERGMTLLREAFEAGWEAGRGEAWGDGCGLSAAQCALPNQHVLVLRLHVRSIYVIALIVVGLAALLAATWMISIWIDPRPLGLPFP